jgi:hypothetical protein
MWVVFTHTKNGLPASRSHVGEIGLAAIAQQLRAKSARSRVAVVVTLVARGPRVLRYMDDVQYA